MKSKAAETHFIIDSKEKSICSYLLEGAISIKKQRDEATMFFILVGSHSFLTFKPLCQKLMGSYKRSAQSTCFYWLLETHSQSPGPAGRHFSQNYVEVCKEEKGFCLLMVQSNQKMQWGSVCPYRHSTLCICSLKKKKIALGGFVFPLIARRLNGGCLGQMNNFKCGALCRCLR